MVAASVIRARRTGSWRNMGVTYGQLMSATNPHFMRTPMLPSSSRSAAPCLPRRESGPQTPAATLLSVSTRASTPGNASRGTRSIYLIYVWGCNSSQGRGETCSPRHASRPGTAASRPANTARGAGSIYVTPRTTRPGTADSRPVRRGQGVLGQIFNRFNTIQNIQGDGVHGRHADGSSHGN